nr:uncharacterized protein LOC109184595 [Ipomoea batatas]
MSKPTPKEMWEANLCFPLAPIGRAFNISKHWFIAIPYWAGRNGDTVTGSVAALHGIWIVRNKAMLDRFLQTPNAVVLKARRELRAWQAAEESRRKGSVTVAVLNPLGQDEGSRYRCSVDAVAVPATGKVAFGFCVLDNAMGAVLLQFPMVSVASFLSHV